MRGVGLLPETMYISHDVLKKAYPTFDKNSGFYLGRLDRLKAGYVKTFGTPGNLRLFTAPGRTEIGGNHTDHQRGRVLAAAVDMDMIAAAEINGSGKIKVKSEGYDMCEIDTTCLKPLCHEKNTTAAIIRGVAAQIAKEGFEIGGFDMYVMSDVPKGSGLSSSAAFEVLVASVMNGLFCNGKLSDVKMAQMGRVAENEYFGKPSGLMDQMASAVGGIVVIDFDDMDNPETEKLNVDFAEFGYALCVIDSGADHAGLTPEYAAIPNEMESVAKFFGKEVLRDVERGLLIENANMIRRECGDRAFLRAIHFVDENERVEREAAFLKEKNMKGFLNEVKESGYSSFMYLQNVVHGKCASEQSMALALCLCHSLLGNKGAFRVHGGGFAGTVQAFVPLDSVDVFVKKIENVLGENCCRMVSIREMGGGEITNVKGS